jgi:transcriptional regulator with XRE-family HTH domain
MKLQEYMDKEGISQSELARRLGVTVGAVCRWLSGNRFPNRPHLQRILDETKGKVTPTDML